MERTNLQLSRFDHLRYCCTCMSVETSVNPKRLRNSDPSIRQTFLSVLYPVCSVGSRDSLTPMKWKLSVFVKVLDTHRLAYAQQWSLRYLKLIGINYFDVLTFICSKPDPDTVFDISPGART